MGNPFAAHLGSSITRFGAKGQGPGCRGVKRTTIAGDVKVGSDLKRWNGAERLETEQDQKVDRHYTGRTC